MSAYVRRTRDEWQLWGNYGPGMEEVCGADSYREARELVKCYRENEPGVPFRLRKMRIPLTAEEYARAVNASKPVDEHLNDAVPAL